jgi:predicted Zn-dependent protease with MMP-like domain
MESSLFEKLVLRAMDQIPDALSAYLDNVDIVVEDWPAQDQLAGHVIEDGDLLLGLYEGVPLTERSDYSMVLPDKITLFQKSIEAICASNEEIIEQIRETVVHEVAHHFGIDDERLEELGV